MKAGIAGAGIMGQLLAFSLINSGWKVTLFDKGKPNCSLAAAGLLTPLAELEKNDLLIFEMGNEALKIHWPNILDKLPKKIYFKQTGSLTLSHPRDDTELKNFIKKISAKLSHENFYQELSQDKVKQVEPDISQFTKGYYFTDEGQIDNQALLNTLQDYLIAKEITWITNTEVTSISPGEIVIEEKKHQFDLVIDCRGLGGKKIFNNLRGIRGELVWLHAPSVFITRPIRFLHPRYGLYLVPRPGNHYLVGASEIESNDESEISVKTMLELLTAVYYINSKFSEARIINTVTQCRPVLPNHLPSIKYAKGFVAINGLYRHGFLIAPTLAHDVMCWVLQKRIPRYQHIWEKYQ